MPDQAGLLSAEEKAKIAHWLSSLGVPAPACQFCGQREWAIADHLVQPVTLGSNNAVMLGGVGYPQIMLISPKCGHTVLINAVIAGLLPAAPALEKK